MKLNVTDKGLLIPKELLGESQEVEVIQEQGQIIITTLQPQPSIWQLGTNPVTADVTDLAENHDQYLYNE